MSGRPPPDIQWYLNGQRLIQDDRHKVIVNEAGSHSLLITKTILSDTGSIACVATNRSGEAAFQVGFYSRHLTINYKFFFIFVGLSVGLSSDFRV